MVLIFKKTIDRDIHYLEFSIVIKFHAKFWVYFDFFELTWNQALSIQLCLFSGRIYTKKLTWKLKDTAKTGVQYHTGFTLIFDIIFENRSAYVYHCDRMLKTQHNLYHVQMIACNIEVTWNKHSKMIKS